MKSAGLKKIKDGFISCDQEQIYFIVGLINLESNYKN